MERFTISLSEDLAVQFDDFIRRKGYQNRSEAIRDLVRAELESFRLERHEAPNCVAALSYVYSHRSHELAERLTELQHRHHDLVLSAMHVHLDHDNCMETLMLRGPTAAVSAFANELTAERDVRHGKLNLITVDVDVSAHGIASPTDSRGHTHAHPRT